MRPLQAHFRIRPWLLLLTAAGLCSCASPEKLARQSGELLAAGRNEAAYEKALDAMDKEPATPEAREALSAAGAAVVSARIREMAQLAPRDLVSAGMLAFRSDDVRGDLKRFNVPLRQDSVQLASERDVRERAASQLYRQSVDELHRGEDDRAAARAAYRHFGVAHRMDPSLRDAEARRADAYELAVVRVAVLPFLDQTRVRGLSVDLEDGMVDVVAAHLDPQQHPFLEMISRDEVHRRMPLSALDDLTRDEAASLGRKLGATHVLWGRYYNLDARTESQVERTPIYGREKIDREGRDPEYRYVEDELRLLYRSRIARVRCQVQLIDTRNGQVVQDSDQPYERGVRVFWTEYRPRFDPDSYQLYTPDQAQKAPQKVEQVKKDWKARAGNWELKQVLKEVSKDEPRPTQGADFRRAYPEYRDTHPLFLPDLPPPGDLAYLALQDTWGLAWDMVRRLSEQ